MRFVGEPEQTHTGLQTFANGLQNRLIDFL